MPYVLFLLPSVWLARQICQARIYRNHYLSESHLFATERFTFVQRARPGVDEQMSEANAQQRSREQVERQENRKVTEIIFDCMRF